METKTEVYPEFEILNALPELMVSNDDHGLRGSDIAINYLLNLHRDNQHLINATKGNGRVQKYHRMLGTMEHDESSGRLSGYVLRKILESKFYERQINLDGAIGIFSVAAFRAESPDYASPTQVGQTLRLADSRVSGLRRGMLRERWIIPYYRDKLKNSKSLDSKRLECVEPFINYALRTSKNPVTRHEVKSDRRKFDKLFYSPADRTEDIRRV